MVTIDDLIKLYINDNLVDEITDNTFREGRIGFVSMDDVRTAYDNVEVFQLE